MIGISQRTHPGAIECIADRLIVIRNGTTFTEYPRGVRDSTVLAAASGALTEDEEAELAERSDDDER